MHVVLKVFPAILSLGIAVLTGDAAARAESITLKSGETVELGSLFWVVNCRSLLKGPPVAEVLYQLPQNLTRGGDSQAAADVTRCSMSLIRGAGSMPAIEITSQI
jgi:hypothetical protein